MAVISTARQYTVKKLRRKYRKGYMMAVRLTVMIWRIARVINTAGRVPYRLTICQKNGMIVPINEGSILRLRA
jgi:hypothetical protein